MRTACDKHYRGKKRGTKETHLLTFCLGRSYVQNSLLMVLDICLGKKILELRVFLLLIKNDSNRYQPAVAIDCVRSLVFGYIVRKSRKGNFRILGNALDRVP